MFYIFMQIKTIRKRKIKKKKKEFWKLSTNNLNDLIVNEIKKKTEI